MTPSTNRHHNRAAPTPDTHEHPPVWALLTLAGILTLSLVAPLIAPYDPRAARNGDEAQPPSAQHWAGTDQLGRDVFSRLLYGGGQTLLTAALALLVAGVPGVLVGLLSGYIGGRTDRAIVALLDGLLAIPGLLLAMTLLTVTGRGLTQVALAVGMAAWPSCARLVRAALLPLRHSLLVEATRSLGATHLHIMGRTLLPALTPTLVGVCSLIVGWAILNAAALHFLGFSGDPGVAEWGAMLAEARPAFRVAPWAAFAPGLAITVTLGALNAIADWLTRMR